MTHVRGRRLQGISCPDLVQVLYNSLLTTFSHDQSRARQERIKTEDERRQMEKKEDEWKEELERRRMKLEELKEKIKEEGARMEMEKRLEKFKLKMTPHVTTKDKTKGAGETEFAVDETVSEDHHDYLDEKQPEFAAAQEPPSATHKEKPDTVDSVKESSIHETPPASVSVVKASSGSAKVSGNAQVRPIRVFLDRTVKLNLEVEDIAQNKGV